MHNCSESMDYCLRYRLIPIFAFYNVSNFINTVFIYCKNIDFNIPSWCFKRFSDLSIKTDFIKNAADTFLKILLINGVRVLNHFDLLPNAADIRNVVVGREAARLQR